MTKSVWVIVSNGLLRDARATTQINALLRAGYRVTAFGMREGRTVPARFTYREGARVVLFPARTTVIALAIALLALPVVAFGLCLSLIEWDGTPPIIRQGALAMLAIAAAVLIPAILYLPSIPFGAGAFGMGDVKFLVGMGLMLGGEHALSGTLFGLILAGVVLVVLLVTRRIGRRSYVPFGPFLIIGALWAVLVLP